MTYVIWLCVILLLILILGYGLPLIADIYSIRLDYMDKRLKRNIEHIEQLEKLRKKKVEFSVKVERWQERPTVKARLMISAMLVTWAEKIGKFKVNLIIKKVEK